MPISPKTVREQVTNQIRDDLVSGRFEAGSMLREIELASRLGVSRGPVRDAFIHLSQEGYLAYYANRGVMVRHPPNPDERTFITSIRQQIETHVVENGIQDLTDESFQKVEAALERLKEACDVGKATGIALRDIEFHESIMRACGGEDLVGAWRQLCSRMLLSYSRHDNYQQTYQEHLEIFTSLSARSVKRTVKALKANIK
ncbi:putative HTH-type transcriptional regulator YdfH [Rubripirellula obstinata]|uniref:Putative HTH-type transcriptional regulator YdfH n=1 Tax=Rubripirellula obstinata TaxID=406547 RepID=A0A5B1CP88_9BACT|nr:GntR family transcriptional regulator [Rubripirellula obstinata]KAA1261104.1 putative HTH-type transcriptional regulator YdfH [Rubripirellula obstinata]